MHAHSSETLNRIARPANTYRRIQPDINNIYTHIVVIHTDLETQITQRKLTFALAETFNLDKASTFIRRLLINPAGTRICRLVV